MPRYFFEGDDEREAFHPGSSPTRYDNPYTDQLDPASPSTQAAMSRPTAHPDSAFQRLREERRGGADDADPAVATAPPSYQQAQQRHGAPQAAHYPPTNNITPGADNFSGAAVGGVAGIAQDVADQNPRQSGVDAMSSPDYPQQTYQQPQPQSTRARPGPAAFVGAAALSGHRNSASSVQQLNTAAEPMAQSSPYGYYTDDPYHGYTGHSSLNLGYVDPRDIQDDGDDGLEYGRSLQGRKSMLSLGNSSNRSKENGAAGAAAGAAAGGAAGAGLLGAMGGLAAGRGARDGNGQYNSVQNLGTGYNSAAGSTYDLGGPGAEKSEWLAKQGSGSKRMRLLIIGAIGLLLAAAIVLGVYFGVIHKGPSSQKDSPGQSASDDADANGDLDINSSEIQALLNNQNLHKVFPGIDYTPIHSQYPDCIENPPSQNNVTRDVAVLSQLSNTIRIYGTDCNQTQMLIHAIDKLELNDTVKIWMGVWKDGNDTTGARQLQQMYDILDTYGADPFKGIIVANEIIFREQMTATELGNLLVEVRSNLTAKGIDLPIATSDLGDDWTAELAAQSDYVMSNIHPFFGGVNAKDAAAWTWTFWQNHNLPLNTDISKNIIAETGWPSQGGTHCGTTDITDCPDAAVAGIDEMNQFLSDWVCPALANGTQYFWFSSFDEPWKIQYNTANQNWEDQWGLMDVNRNLKAGVTIPDCGGQEVGAA